MSQHLTIEVAEEVYLPLQQWAIREGKTPEALAHEWVCQRVQELAADPLMKWAGAIDADVADVAERHDEYLGEALARELRGSADA